MGREATCQPSWHLMSPQAGKMQRDKQSHMNEGYSPRETAAGVMRCLKPYVSAEYTFTCPAPWLCTCKRHQQQGKMGEMDLSLLQPTRGDTERSKE